MNILLCRSMANRADHRRPADKDVRKKMVFLMNQLSPGTEWCTRFLASFDEKAIAGVSDAEVSQVRAWASRVEQLKKQINREPSMESVPMTENDKTMQRDIKLLQSKFGRQSLSGATPQKPARPEDPKKDKTAASKPVSQTVRPVDSADPIHVADTILFRKSGCRESL
jgi:hypothetical protein